MPTQTIFMKGEKDVQLKQSIDVNVPILLIYIIYICVRVLFHYMSAYIINIFFMLMIKIQTMMKLTIGIVTKKSLKIYYFSKV